MIVVRYADDTIVGFQRHADADRFLRELRARLAAFSLDLHPDKTRLIEFGRFAAERRLVKGLPKPETFDSQHIHQPVHYLAHVHRALVAASLGTRYRRLDQRPLLISQVAGIAQLAAVVAGTVLGGPHRLTRRRAIAAERLAMGKPVQGPAPGFSPGFRPGC